MSQENIERLREAYELLNTHFAALKAGDLDPLLDFFDPEIRFERVFSETDELLPRFAGNNTLSGRPAQLPADLTSLARK
jgi:ketosteroid isomerase-like protein